jgi:hypothetical protein
VSDGAEEERGTRERALALPLGTAWCFEFSTQRRKGAKAQKGKEMMNERGSVSFGER